jgi:hypothetical protein
VTPERRRPERAGDSWSGWWRARKRLGAGGLDARGRAEVRFGERRHTGAREVRARGRAALGLGPWELGADDAGRHDVRAGGALAWRAQEPERRRAGALARIQAVGGSVSRRSAGCGSGGIGARMRGSKRGRTRTRER